MGESERERPADIRLFDAITPYMVTEAVSTTLGCRQMF